MFHLSQGPVAQSGSASRSQREGQGFKSPQVHNTSEPLSESSGRGSDASYSSEGRQLRRLSLITGRGVVGRSAEVLAGLPQRLAGLLGRGVRTALRPDRCPAVPEELPGISAPPYAIERWCRSVVSLLEQVETRSWPTGTVGYNGRHDGLLLREMRCPAHTGPSEASGCSRRSRVRQGPRPQDLARALDRPARPLRHRPGALGSSFRGSGPPAPEAFRKPCPPDAVRLDRHGVRGTPEFRRRSPG